MQQETVLTRAIPARVLGFLSRESVYVVPYAGMRADESNNGKWGFQSKMPVPRDAWPDDLLRLNAEVWLIYQSRSSLEWGTLIDVCPRDRDELPECYRAAIAESEQVRHREFRKELAALPAHEPFARPHDAFPRRRRWWQFWR